MICRQRRTTSMNAERHPTNRLLTTGRVTNARPHSVVTAETLNRITAGWHFSLNHNVSLPNHTQIVVTIAMCSHLDNTLIFQVNRSIAIQYCVRYRVSYDPSIVYFFLKGSNDLPILIFEFPTQVPKASRTRRPKRISMSLTGSTVASPKY